MRAAPPRLVVASSNPGKLRELRSLLEALPVEICGLADVAPVRLPEEGDDYTANAVAKARAVADQLGLAALADDSGLEVDALGGAPGPRSARYGGPGLDDAARAARLLAELADVAPGDRGARFVCVAALARPDGSTATARGECAGRIRDAPAGGGGFGYDPVFEPEGHAVTMAQLPEAEKNRISHRARALAALAPELRRLAQSR